MRRAAPERGCGLAGEREGTLDNVATATARAAADSAAPRHVRDRSAQASTILSDLMGVDPAWRAEFMAGLDESDRLAVFAAARRELGTPYGLWVDDPVGFVEVVLGESLWGKQRELARALVTAKRVAVPSAVGTGKTHTASRLVAWHSCVYPVGTALTVTTATRFRQVKRQLWPHVGRLAAKARLPGVVDTTQWKMPDANGVLTEVAYGFTAPANDEAATQGIHAPKLLILVDEAGGIGHTIGKGMRSILTGGARLLAIGNPPTDDEGSWFEGLTLAPDVVTIPIPADQTPAFTGERVRCRVCPPVMEPHPVTDHLSDQSFVADAIRENGEDSPYVIAKVRAEFPKGGSARVIPSAWVEAAVEQPDPDEGLILGRFVGPDDKHTGSERRVVAGAWIRLGVDVAADGGDELVVARRVGDLAQICHVSSGADNDNVHTVAGKVLAEIRRAEELARRLGTERRVRVKVDGIGLGWGVVGVLEGWRSEGLHGAEVVPVIVSEGVPERAVKDSETLLPGNKRAEMWLSGRADLQPGPDGEVKLRLDVDDKTAAQLRGPKYATTSRGVVQIEGKKSMKERGLSSPDRAEALLLAGYEPQGKRKRARLLN